MHTINVKRCIDGFSKDGGTKEYEIIIFTDASKIAYAAVVFLKISDGRSSTVNLIFAKTRLAPIKTTLTIPRLELLAVLTGCRISQFVAKELDIKLSKQITIFTDAACVLEWCKTSKPLKKFVMDRINEIKSYDVALKYVKSEDNPADIASRGQNVEGLKTTEIWWKGPEWLLFEEKIPLIEYELNEKISAVMQQEKKKNSRVFEAGLMVDSN